MSESQQCQPQKLPLQIDCHCTSSWCTIPRESSFKSVSRIDPIHGFGQWQLPAGTHANWSCNSAWCRDADVKAAQLGTCLSQGIEDLVEGCCWRCRDNQEVQLWNLHAAQIDSMAFYPEYNFPCQAATAVSALDICSPLEAAIRGGWYMLPLINNTTRHTDEYISKYRLDALVKLTESKALRQNELSTQLKWFCTHGGVGYTSIKFTEYLQWERIFHKTTTF